LITTHTIHRFGGRSFPVALLAAAALALPSVTAAQDASGSPVASTGIPFPVLLGGQLLTAETYTGPEYLALFSDGASPDPAFVQGMTSLVEGAGKTIDDLTVKMAEYEPTAGEAAVVVALRLDGTDARDWVRPAVDTLVADVTDPGLLLRPIDTKWAIRVTDATMPGVYPRTVYLKDDTAWFIQGDNDYVYDALSQLPDPELAGMSEADSLITDLPLSLGGQRRMGLLETVDPIFLLPTIGDRLATGSTGSEWLLDLYLDAHTSPSDLLGVIAWWGPQASDDGIQIEGYRLPPGGKDMTQRMLDEVFLAGGDAATAAGGPLEGVTIGHETIADREVTSLDYSGTKQYLFSSADTVWVVTDPLGQRDRVEEAVAELP
jgi:hypothetical protein